MQSKIFSVLIATAIFISSVNFAFAETIPLISPTGNHIGEKPPLQYSIEYLDPKGITTVGPTGIIFAPFSDSATQDPTILPLRYFGSYPLYFTNSTMNFVVHLKNVSQRTYQNLLVTASQEFLNADGGWGAPFPSSYISDWSVDELKPEQYITLSGSLSIPDLSASGIDQTHLQILHWDGSGKAQENIGSGRVILDDSQAGIWCPLALNQS